MREFLAKRGIRPVDLGARSKPDNAGQLGLRLAAGRSLIRLLGVCRCSRRRISAIADAVRRSGHQFAVLGVAARRDLSPRQARGQSIQAVDTAIRHDIIRLERAARRIDAPGIQDVRAIRPSRSRHRETSRPRSRSNREPGCEGKPNRAMRPARKVGTEKARAEARSPSTSPRNTSKRRRSTSPASRPRLRPCSRSPLVRTAAKSRVFAGQFHIERENRIN